MVARLTEEERALLADAAAIVSASTRRPLRELERPNSRRHSKSCTGSPTIWDMAAIRPEDRQPTCVVNGRDCPPEFFGAAVSGPFQFLVARAENHRSTRFIHDP